MGFSFLQLGDAFFADFPKLIEIVGNLRVFFKIFFEEILVVVDFEVDDLVGLDFYFFD